jgi:hypothetical protein
MINTPISYVHVDSTFLDRLEADLHLRGRWSNCIWNVLSFLWQEVLHA